MEGSAKGQVGGLEASKEQRERLAGLSGAWKCGQCMGGKSNEEVLKENEERCKELGIRSEAGEKETVPEELKMGFKNEKGEVVTDEPIVPGEEGEEDAELAEGFVRTGNQGQAAMPVQSVPQPTPTVRAVPNPEGLPVAPPATTAPARIANAYPLQQQQQLGQRTGNDGVPVWVDRSIAVVVFLLALMILKIMLGL